MNVRDLQPSMTVELADKARALKRQGKDVISFSAGEPDFDTPAHITEAAVKSLRGGFTHYVSSRGILKLRESIARKLSSENGIAVDPENGIIVTASSKLALYLSLVGLLAPGDEVLVLEPAWVSYASMVKLASAHPVSVPLDWRTAFRIDEDPLEACITSRTRAVVLNSPNNPTGRILSVDELGIVERLADKHDLFVISDEIYDRIVYDSEHTSPASLRGLASRTLTINGFSKTHAMTGWRLGYVAGSEALISQILLAQQHIVTCATAFVQEAGIAALDGPQEPIEEMMRAYRKRRDYIIDALNDIPGVRCTVPDGTFYAFPRIEGGHVSSQELADRLLEASLVATTPGVAFGQAGEGHLRLSFACSMEEIEIGMRRMREFFSS